MVGRRWHLAIATFSGSKWAVTQVPWPPTPSPTPTPPLPTTHSIFIILFFHTPLNASPSELPDSPYSIHSRTALSWKGNVIPEAHPQAIRTCRILPSFLGILPVLRILNSRVPQKIVLFAKCPRYFQVIKTSDTSNNATNILTLSNNGRKQLQEYDNHQPASQPTSNNRKEVSERCVDWGL